MPTVEKGKQWNSTLRRKTPLRAKLWDRKTVKEPKKPAFKRGPKTRKWDSDREKLKKEFHRAGITRCELNYDGCQRDNFLGFAHSKKRRNVVTTDDREEVILACQNCHDRIEKQTHVLMYNIVNLVIAERETPVRSVLR